MSTWYEDANSLFEEATELLEQIKQIEIDSVKDSDKLKRAQPKIKNFLDNCRAPLDYLAVYLRDTYTNSKQRVYFPFAYNQQTFERRIKSDFKNKLPSDILISIQSVLPFYYNSQALGWLNILTNENKHQKLSSKNQILKQTINRIDLPGNNVMTNCVAINCTGTPLTVDGIEYDLINNFPNATADVSNKFILIFEDYDLEVVPLLEDVLYNSQKVIEEINAFKH